MYIDTNCICSVWPWGLQRLYHRFVDALFSAAITAGAPIQRSALCTPLEGGDPSPVILLKVPPP